MKSIVVTSRKDNNLNNRKFYQFNQIRDGIWELRYNSEYEKKINYNYKDRTYSSREVTILINELIEANGSDIMINII